jgi:hypothetical protein
MNVFKVIFMMIIFLFLYCRNKVQNREKQIPIDNEIVVDARLEDLLGTWADYRLVNKINEVSREQVFKPASGFWFDRDNQNYKIILNIQYLEHNYQFLFDSLFFKRSNNETLDSCFSVTQNEKKFLFLFDRENKTIKGLRLIDHRFIGDKPSNKNIYQKITDTVIRSNIEQFALGKYLLDSVFTVVYKGREYKIRKAFRGGFYRIKGLLHYSTLQIVSWNQKEEKAIEIALADKGDFEFFELTQKNDSVYLLSKN